MWKSLWSSNECVEGLNLACSPYTSRVFAWRSERVSQWVVYFTNNTPVRGAHGWEQSYPAFLFSFFFFCIFHAVALGPRAFSLKRATLKEPLNAAQHRVGVMREMAVFATRLCRLRDGQRCRLRYTHSSCSFNELWLTASRCISGRNMMCYWRP